MQISWNINTLVGGVDIMKVEMMDFWINGVKLMKCFTIVCCVLRVNVYLQT